ncbi:MAG: redoxin domain-containing protein [Acidobacteriota bacterium]
MFHLSLSRTLLLLMTCVIALTIACRDTGSAARVVVDLVTPSQEDKKQIDRLVSAARRALDHDELDDAKVLYRSALELNRRDPLLWLGLAKAHGEAGDRKASLEALERAWNDGFRFRWGPPQEEKALAKFERLGFESWIRDHGSFDAPHFDESELAIDEAHRQACRELTLKAIETSGSGAISLRLQRSEAHWELAHWEAASLRRFAELTDDPAEKAAYRVAIQEVLGDPKDYFLRGSHLDQLVKSANELETWLRSDHPDRPELLARTLTNRARLERTRRQWAFDDPEAAEAHHAAAVRLVEEATSLASGHSLHQALALHASLVTDDAALVGRLGERLLASVGDDSVALEMLKKESKAAWLIVASVPDFATTTLDGEDFTPESLRGEVTLIDFWATWCGPCIRELPHLREAQQRHPKLRVVGIALDDEEKLSREDFETWCRDKDVTWTQVFEGVGKNDSKLAQAFEVKGIPFMVLVGEEGQVLAAGDELRGEKMAATLDRVMSGDA